ncbi:MAG: hypothetical protein WD793_05425 [Steroidobacteraceae bacterium]
MSRKACSPLAVDRFRQHVIHAGHAAFLHLLAHRVCGEPDHGDTAAAGADAPRRLEPVHHLATSYRKIGSQLIETSEGERGREYLRRGLAVQEQLAEDQPANLEIQQELAATHNVLGLALEESGDAAGALARTHLKIAKRCSHE